MLSGIKQLAEPNWPSSMSPYGVTRPQWVNTLRPRQHGRHFADHFRRIFLNKNVRISINISLRFVPKGSINNIPPLVQKMAWRRLGDKPFSEPMVVRLPTHKCVTRPQWVKSANAVLTWFIVAEWQCHMILVNIGSGNCLMPDSTKPLPWLMLTSQ